MRKLVFYFVALLFYPTSSSFAQVAADGKTHTSVSTAADGHVTVNIAPVKTLPGVNNDTSYNTYTDFNVLKPGVTLDNTHADARTIINEVTSSNPSLLMGALDVLGPQAHVILANPNGITVNGGRFINTGGVALSTGKVSFVDRPLTPITRQRNVVLTTNRGMISIEGEGLAGVFSNLELIAKQISINAPIKNEQDLPNARVRLTGGSSTTEFDSSISVVDIDNNWSTVSENSKKEEECPNAICVNITGLGSISSSKIELAVTEEGAGVKMDGKAAATQGNFVIASNGQVEINGEVSTVGSSVINTKGEVKIAGKVEAAAENIVSSDTKVTLAKTATVSGNRTTVQSKHIALESGENDKGEWQQAHLWSINGSTRINASDELVVTGAEVLADNNAIVTAGKVTLQAVQDSKGQWHQPSIAAIDGGLVVKTTMGSIYNYGGILQGTKAIEGNADSTLGVSLISASQIENRSFSQDAVATIYGVDDGISLIAQGTIRNIAGQLNSNGRLKVHSATSDFYNIIEKSTVENEGEVEIYSRKGGSSFFRSKKIKGQRVAYGEAEIPDVSADVSADGDIEITAANTYSVGGNILSYNGAVTVNTGHFINEMEITGSAYAETSCAWLCSSRGSSNLNTHGGILQGKGDITINATGSIINRGGIVQSTEGQLIVNSPEPIIAESKEIVEFIRMDRGMFNDDYVRFLRYDQGGSFIANMGKLSIKSLSPVQLDGGTITAKEQEIENGVNTIRTPSDRPSSASGGGIGALGGVF